MQELIIHNPVGKYVRKFTAEAERLRPTAGKKTIPAKGIAKNVASKTSQRKKNQQQQL